MRLLVVGATGSIGSAVVEAAHRAGHEVTVLVRSPEKVDQAGWGSRVRIRVGDLLDATAVADTLPEQEAVINAVGSSPDRDQLEVPATIMRDLLAGMDRHGIRRLVGLAGGAVDVPGERKPLSGRLTSAMVRLLARNVVAAKQREFAVVHASDLDWTMVRPPRVTPGPPTGRVEVGDRLHSFRISSGDLAEAMVRLVAGRDWLRRAPYVSELRTAGKSD
jgi:putative NADH-flavin reductase